MGRGTLGSIRVGGRRDDRWGAFADLYELGVDVAFEIGAEELERGTVELHQTGASQRGRDDRE